MLNKKTLLSGITATGKLTLGNYIGAIKNMVKLQDEYNSFVFIADLHALTLPIDPKILEQNRHNIYALYLACGLDPNKTTIFFNLMLWNMDLWIDLSSTTQRLVNCHVWHNLKINHKKLNQLMEWTQYLQDSWCIQH